MRYLHKIWVRLLFSLFGAGVLSEAHDLYTGAAYGPRPPSHPLFWLFFAFVFVGLSAFVWYMVWRQAGKNAGAEDNNGPDVPTS